jgi:hypothetical protein
MTLDAALPLEAATVEEPPPHRSAEDQVSQLLREAASQPEPTAEKQTPDAPPEPEKAWDLKSVAEKLGTDPARLYADLRVGFEDGTELTLGALKDAYRPAAELEKARGKLLEDMESSKREVVQTQQEFSALLQLLGPQNLNQELLAEVNRRTEKQKADEAERLLKAIPEWKDPIARAADKAGAAVGYTDAELRLAEAGYADHRLIALLRQVTRGPKPEVAKPEAKKGMAPQKAKSPSAAPSVRDLKAAVRRKDMTSAEAVTSILKGAKVI